MVLAMVQMMATSGPQRRCLPVSVISPLLPLSRPAHSLLPSKIDVYLMYEHGFSLVALYVPASGTGRSESLLCIWRYDV